MAKSRLRHGFKKEAEGIAGEVRKDIGLAPFDPLCMWRLAEHLGVPVLSLSELHEVPGAVETLLGPEQGAFSAMTVFYDTRRAIVNNDSHSLARQSSNLGHELAHGLLMHQPRPAMDERLGCRHWDDVIEDEAEWLGGCLLIPDEAAFRIAQREPTSGLDGVAERYIVSNQMLEWRLNVTGARKRVERTQRTRRRAGHP